MTTQTRKFIELADILGMRFDCDDSVFRLVKLLPRSSDLARHARDAERTYGSRVGNGGAT
jgi:hypothetical protein